MPGWTITRISESVTVDPGTTGIIRTKVVQFKVGAHGPFQIELPAAEFTSARVAMLLDEQAQHIQQLTG